MALKLAACFSIVGLVLEDVVSLPEAGHYESEHIDQVVLEGEDKCLQTVNVGEHLLHFFIVLWETLSLLEVGPIVRD